MLYSGIWQRLILYDVVWYSMICDMILFRDNSTVQCGLILIIREWYTKIQHSIIQYSMVQYNSVLYYTVHYVSIQLSMVHYKTVWYNTVQYSTIQSIRWLRSKPVIAIRGLDS